MTEESSQPEATAPGNAAEDGPRARPQAGPEAGPAGGAGVAGGADVAGGTADAPATGDPRVDEALTALATLGDAPDTGHVQAFEHVHRRLHEILGEVAGDDQPGGGHDRR